MQTFDNKPYNIIIRIQSLRAFVIFVVLIYYKTTSAELCRYYLTPKAILKIFTLY